MTRFSPNTIVLSHFNLSYLVKSLNICPNFKCRGLQQLSTQRQNTCQCRQKYSLLKPIDFWLTNTPCHTLWPSPLSRNMAWVKSIWQHSCHTMAQMDPTEDPHLFHSTPNRSLLCTLLFADIPHCVQISNNRKLSLLIFSLW